jgi:hypothetical protein
VHTTCLVCFISTVNGRSKKERKEAYTGARSGHITNLKQSILETFYIYDAKCHSLYCYASVGYAVPHFFIVMLVLLMPSVMFFYAKCYISIVMLV